MNVVAKFRCTRNAPIAHAGESRQVNLTAVYSDDPASPNHSWSKWTPSGTLTLHISNPAAYDQFVVDEEYLIRFEKA